MTRSVPARATCLRRLTGTWYPSSVIERVKNRLGTTCAYTDGLGNEAERRARWGPEY